MAVGGGEAALAIDVAKHLQSLAQASKVLSKGERRALDRAAEVGKRVLQHGVEQLVVA